MRAALIDETAGKILLERIIDQNSYLKNVIVKGTLIVRGFSRKHGIK